MLYGGTLGLAIHRGAQNVNMERVQEVYRGLCQLNPMHCIFKENGTSSVKSSKSNGPIELEELQTGVIM